MDKKEKKSKGRTAEADDIRNVFQATSMERKDSSSIKIPTTNTVRPLKSSQVIFFIVLLRFHLTRLFVVLQADDDSDDDKSQANEITKYYQNLLEESRQKVKKLSDELRDSEEKRVCLLVYSSGQGFGKETSFSSFF